MRALLALALTLFAACSTTTQTTSGAAFLSARSGTVDPDVARAAAIEPNLQFPARIGIARIINNRLTLPPAAELAVLPDPAGLGSFTVINPLITDTLHPPVQHNPLRAAQLTAARQHQDYVLIYALSQTGAGLGKSGQANAVLMDVRTGYIYGSAAVSQGLASYGSRWLGWGQGYGLTDQSAERLARTLAPEVVKMFTELSQNQG